MSSNAFARSRPRVRHQRVPRTHCYVHPRFLQLVKELARLDEAKKKQEEAEGACSSGRNSDEGERGAPNDCTNVASTTSTPTVVEYSNNNDGCCGTTSLSGSSSSTSTSSSGGGGTDEAARRFNTICSGVSLAGGVISCRGTTINQAQTSNGYRSLDNNQSTSTLHDNYYRQNHNNNTHHIQYHHQFHHQAHHHNQHHNHHHHHHSGTTNHHIHHQHNNNHPHQEPNHLSNIDMHHPDDRCPNKCSSTNFGYSKQSLVEQNNSSDLSTNNNNNNTDLRQDENRSKRKRSSNDSASNSKKISASSSSSSSSSSCSSKRHKSSPEPIRPLSPSFTKCPICLLDCMSRGPSFTNTCFHLFCYVCIENWTKNKATCPLCRTKFTKIIYNIRSASCYDEKIASPIRRDDDDDRVIYEQLQGLNTNSMVPTRNINTDDAHLIFENLRNNDVLMPPFPFVNQMDRQVDSLHSFNTVTAPLPTNFNSSVPHTSFTTGGYPITSSYIALIQPNRIQPTTSTAITSAYTTNSGLTNINTDPNNRRISRSGRYVYSRNYDMPTIDGSARVSRTSSSSMNQSSNIPIERQHHHQHQSHHQQHHQHSQHRSTIDMGTRQNHPSHLHMPYSTIQPRHYNVSVYNSRRPYTNPPIDQHILDNLYRQMPDM